MFLFTDGSRLNNSDTVAGAGWYGHWGAWKQESACGHLNLPKHESMTTSTRITLIRASEPLSLTGSNVFYARYSIYRRISYDFTRDMAIIRCSWM